MASDDSRNIRAASRRELQIQMVIARCVASGLRSRRRLHGAEADFFRQKMFGSMVAKGNDGV